MSTSLDVSPHTGAAPITAARAKSGAVGKAERNIGAEVQAQQKQAHTPMQLVPQLDRGVQVIAGPDRALNSIASSLRVHVSRTQILLEGKRLDVSRVESEEYLHLLLESLPELSKVPAIRSIFLCPAFGLVYEQPRNSVRSRLGLGGVASEVKDLQPLYETRREEVAERAADADGARMAAPVIGKRRAYVAVGMQEGHLLYGRRGGKIEWEELDHASLMKVLGRELAKLGNLHAAGFEAGDTSISNTMVSRGLEPYLISMGHLKPLNERTRGLPEVLSIMTAFAHDLNVEDLLELMPNYLQTEGAKERAESYLKYHHSTSRRTKNRPYEPHTPLEDRLVGRVEDLVNQMPAEYKEAA